MAEMDYKTYLQLYNYATRTKDHARYDVDGDLLVSLCDLALDRLSDMTDNGICMSDEEELRGRPYQKEDHDAE